MSKLDVHLIRCISGHKWAKLRKAQQNLQRDTRKRVNNYWFDLCEKIQVAADSGNLREMYDGIKAAIGPVKRKVAPLKDLEGNLLIDKSLQLKRWIEHYDALYGREPDIDAHVIDNLPNLTCVDELHSIPTVNELLEAIRELSNNKATGTDGIPAELLKILAVPHSPKLKELHNFVGVIGKMERFPSVLKTPSLNSFTKTKGTNQTVIVIVVSQCWLFLGKQWPESSSRGYKSLESAFIQANVVSDGFQIQ